MSVSGGPLPFPGDLGRQVSCPILPPTPSQGDSWITRIAARAAVGRSRGPDYGEDALAMTSFHSGCFLYWAST